MIGLQAIVACKKQYVAHSCLKEVNIEKPMVIHYSSTGCFATISETLTISKLDNSYKWKLEHTMNNTSVVTEGICSSDFPKAYEYFEKEGTGYTTQNQCTTVSDWTIATANNTLSFTDGDCKLTGYYKLKETLK